jgi:hypothetical protein
MKQLTTAQRVQVIAALVEGNSINSTVRMTGVSKPTILRLIGLMGEACTAYHDEHVRGLSCERVQCDEIWAFCYAKSKNVPAEHQGEFGFGDVWTWTALDADRKLMISWFVGDRSKTSATTFLRDVAERVVNRIQLTTDGLASYLDAVYRVFGNDVDHAVLHKVYGPDYRGRGPLQPSEGDRHRYPSPLRHA